MTRRITFLATILFLTLAVSSTDIHAVKGVLTGQVVKTLVAANAFGQCMALLDREISTASNAPNCPGGWVTFSCSGVFASKDIAYRMLDQAQLAKALGRPVVIVVDDTKKHNGVCFANRIEVE